MSSNMLLHGMKQEEHRARELSYVNPQPQPQHHPVQQRKRAREEDKAPFHDTHKDDAQKDTPWQFTALEQPVPPQTRTLTTPWSQTQQRASLLPDPEVYNYNPTNKQDEGGDTTRLPSIKHLRLDPTRSRHEWDPYGTDPAHPYSPYPTTASYPATQRSPLKVTQTITAPPPSPQPQVTELVQVKTNTYGFIETTFTNVPAKKAHRRRPANVDKDTLYCHTCGSKNTPEWRRGPKGPATLCNACGLAYAKRLRQEEETQAISRLEQQHSEAPSSPTSSLSQFSQYPTLALSDLYQQPGLFHPLPGFQQPYQHITEHGWVPHSPSSFSSAAFSPSRPSPTFRSAHNRPNGHTFHQYTPPISHPPTPYVPSNAHVPIATATTTMTTSLFPSFTISPSEIPIVTPPEPPNVNSFLPPSTPATPTIDTSNTLPVLTTLSNSTADDITALGSLNRLLTYRTVPNTPLSSSLSSSASAFSSPYIAATPTTSSAPYTPTTPFTPTSSSSSSPSSSPSSSTSSFSSARSHSPTLTPITTIAALSNSASPPSS